jgi:hypothetical protein
MFKTHCSFIQHTDIDDDGVPFTFPVQNPRLCSKVLQNVEKIPGRPIAYWLSDAFLRIFDDAIVLKEIGDTRQGMATSDNGRFLRLWHEVGHSRIGFGLANSRLSRERGSKWIPYNKGGDFRKWWGNQNFVVNWENEGTELLDYARGLYGSPTRTIKSMSEYFKPSVSWSKVSSGALAVRYFPTGFIFDVAGCSVFSDSEDNRRLVLSFLNTSLAKALLKFFCPSLNFEAGQIARLPILATKLKPLMSRLSELAGDCIAAEQSDWDNFETSWDFRDQPLLRPGLKGATLEASWRNWEAQSTAAIRRMQELETENNRLFIAAYGLDGELQPEVPEEQITLARSEDRRDMAAFLSYAIGCMMGRYSPDHPGLILADAGDSLENYLSKVGKSMGQLTFEPDADGIIPVLDAEWFDDDIVARTKEFLRTTFGESALAENLRFIEESLGKDLRNYFLADFYKDHLQTYKNRPIYWLFSSGKQRAFQCLVYLHRYQEGTLPRIRTEYVIPLQGKVAAAISRLEEEIPNTTSSSTRKKLQTELDKTKKQMAELLAYDEQLRSYADQRIALDLDDGVKVNYAKFGPLVAETKKICGTKDD